MGLSSSPIENQSLRICRILFVALRNSLTITAPASKYIVLFDSQQSRR